MVRVLRLTSISKYCLVARAELKRTASMCAEGNVFWTDQNQVYGDNEDRPVLSRKQALDKFGQYLLSYRSVDAKSNVVSYGCAFHSHPPPPTRPLIHTAPASLTPPPIPPQLKTGARK